MFIFLIILIYGKEKRTIISQDTLYACILNVWFMNETLHISIGFLFVRIRYMYIESKVFYGQEPPSGESTTTECGVNYQLLPVFTEVAQWGAPSCSRPQRATNNCVGDGRSN